MQDIPIGTKEDNTEKLTPKNVQIIDVEEQTPNTKDGKEIKPKFVFLCKHPDKEDLIEISKVKYENQGKLVIHGTWKSLDSEGKLAKKSAVATLLHTIGANSILESRGKQAQTTTEENGYLVFKGY